jgi:hypothetical protein
MSPKVPATDPSLDDQQRLVKSMCDAYFAESKVESGDDLSQHHIHVMDSADGDLPLSPHPYPGLRSFNSNEGSVFFGRERNVQGIRERLRERRLVVVLGGSGSGKSSVIRAGLMPRLNSTMGIEGRSGNWYAAEFRPGRDPMNSLALALTDLVRQKFSAQGSVPKAMSSDREPTTEHFDADEVFTRLRAVFRSSLEPIGDKIAPDRSQRREAVAKFMGDGLFDFVENELNQRDNSATRGYRSGPPSLLLLIDQFEEVFRPEVPSDARDKFLNMIIATYARFLSERAKPPEQRSGLFIAITMRSEELHRCTEHPGLSVELNGKAAHSSLADLVTASGYLLDLLDPVEDRAELSQAIVRPARRVFEDWSLPFDRKNILEPFDEEVVNLLLKGVERLSRVLNHRSDQLPLLQHALQAVWEHAINDWGKCDTPYPRIQPKHLTSAGAVTDSEAADLARIIHKFRQEKATDSPKLCY